MEPVFDPPHPLEIWHQFCVLAKLCSTAPLSAEDQAHRTHLKLWIRASQGYDSPWLVLLEKLGDKATITLEDWEYLSDLVGHLLTYLRPTPDADAPVR